MRDDARRLAGGTADLNFVAGWHRRDDAVTVIDLEKFGFFERDVQTDSEIIRKVIAADGNDGGMGY